MNVFTIVMLAGMALWWVPPLRRLVVERTNRTVKVLLVLLPVMYAANLIYSFFWGQRDESTTVGFTVLALLIVWGGLIAVGNWMERRHAAPPLAPSLGSMTRFPGMPRQMGELGRATVAKAARDAAVTDAATRAADVAVNVGIPAAVRMVGMVSPLAGRIAQAAAPSAIRAAQAATPGMVRAAQAAAPGMIKAAQGVAPGAADSVSGAVRAVRNVDTGSVAMAAGRASGRLFARARRSINAVTNPPA
ncbi:MAG: hypothetical protein EBQ56_07095 [Proteobacteria bacterium]|jgi:hypothetical protein|nr:hypothetical protein [Pseudomonadota bacterium]NBQ30755.1 hypothetical protein [Pseudomonadota bacterium]NBQ61529.1 hypothetical protein [Pseudomonadota bacterium]NBT02038.1 hypothetical protein [Pseudomonadota bacterium]NBT18359.1 hypothetical protein [Pseudomonadota bacterium]